MDILNLNARFDNGSKVSRIVILCLCFEKADIEAILSLRLYIRECAGSRKHHASDYKVHYYYLVVSRGLNDISTTVLTLRSL